MNANSVNQIQRNHNIKRIEIAVYTVLAIFLIGHVFFIDSLLSPFNVALLASGIVFGLMAAVAWTPFSKRFSVPDTFNNTESISVRKIGKTNTEYDTEERHAA